MDRCVAALLLLYAVAAAADATSGPLVIVPVNNIASSAWLPDMADGRRAASLLSQGKQMTLLVTLRSKDPQGLDDRARDVTDSKSKWYQQYLTPSQFGRAFGASSKAVSEVTSYLTSQGLNVYIQSNRLTMEVKGTAAQVGNAFNAQLVAVHAGRFTAGNGSSSVGIRKTLHAPRSHPMLPSHVAAHVAAVHGLDNLPVVSPSDGVLASTSQQKGRKRALLHTPGKQVQVAQWHVAAVADTLRNAGGRKGVDLAQVVVE